MNAPQLSAAAASWLDAYNILPVFADVSGEDILGPVAIVTAIDTSFDAYNQFAGSVTTASLAINILTPTSFPSALETHNAAAAAITTICYNPVDLALQTAAITAELESVSSSFSPSQFSDTIVLKCVFSDLPFSRQNRLVQVLSGGSIRTKIEGVFLGSISGALQAQNQETYATSASFAEDILQPNRVVVAFTSATASYVPLPNQVTGIEAVFNPVFYARLLMPDLALRISVTTTPGILSQHNAVCASIFDSINLPKGAITGTFAKCHAPVLSAGTTTVSANQATTDFSLLCKAELL